MAQTVNVADQAVQFVSDLSQVLVGAPAEFVNLGQMFRMLPQDRGLAAFDLRDHDQIVLEVLNGFFVVHVKKCLASSFILSRRRMLKYRKSSAVHPRRSTQDWLLEAIAFAALVATFVLVFGHWQRLPVFARRGSGESLSVMVLLNAGVYVLLTLAARYQQLVNIPFEIDRDRPEVKQLLLRMTIVLKTVLMVMLAGLLWIIVNTPLGRMRTLGRGFLAVFLVAMLAPTLIYVRKLSRFRK